MKDITVTYLINEEEYERLEKITAEYKKQGLDLTPEKMFNGIMTAGSKFDKDAKFNFHEWKLGLKETYIPAHLSKSEEERE
jgi:hypothetical protein